MQATSKVLLHPNAQLSPAMALLEILQLAEAGEIDSIALAYMKTDKTIHTSWSWQENTSLLGLASVLQHTAIKEIIGS